MVKKFICIKQSPNGENYKQIIKKIKSFKSILKNEIIKENSENEDEDIKKYNEDYKKYISTKFNSKIINMLVIYINKNKDKIFIKKNEEKDKKNKNENNHKEKNKHKFKSINRKKSLIKFLDEEKNFIIKFVRLIKKLLLNEIEFTYLTLLLDKLGWQWKDYDNWAYFRCLGIYTKKKVTDQDASDQVFDILDEEQKSTHGILFDELDLDEKVIISIKEIYSRFKELNQPINTYCRNDFINYNNIVDIILNECCNYGEENKGNQIINQENKNEITNTTQNQYQKENNISLNYISKNKSKKSIDREKSKSSFEFINQNNFNYIRIKEKSKNVNFSSFKNNSRNSGIKEVNKSMSRFSNYTIGNDIIYNSSYAEKNRKRNNKPSII